MAWRWNEISWWGNEMAWRTPSQSLDMPFQAMLFPGDNRSRAISCHVIFMRQQESGHFLPCYFHATTGVRSFHNKRVIKLWYMHKVFHSHFSDPPITLLPTHYSPTHPLLSDPAITLRSSIYSRSTHYSIFDPPFTPRPTLYPPTHQLLCYPPITLHATHYSPTHPLLSDSPITRCSDAISTHVGAPC